VIAAQAVMEIFTCAGNSKYAGITGAKNSAFATLLFIENEVFGIKQTFTKIYFYNFIGSTCCNAHRNA